jgi:hypothetical protein
VAGFGGVTEQVVHLGRSHESLVAHHMIAVVEPDPGERSLAELADAVGFTGGHHEIVRFVVLQHAPHGVDVVASEAPIAFGLEVAEVQFVLLAGGDRATPLVILRVTKFSPRRGDSWLNKMPLLAKMP